MKTSENGLKIIKNFEGLHDGSKAAGLQPQNDGAGIWTEGWGRAMRDSRGNFLRVGSTSLQEAIRRSTIANVVQADAALCEDLSPIEHLVAKQFTVPLSQNQFDALVSFYYNTGGSSTLRNLINSGAPKSVVYNWWISHYITGQGIPMKGLVKRRKMEADLFFS